MAQPEPQESRPERFQRLPPGRTSRSTEETAAHQRQRLIGAMIDAVSRNGFVATTLREVVALAGVSNTAFYRHFNSLQDCLLAAFDQIMAEAGTQIAGAYFSTEGFPERLRAAFRAYVETLIADPAATHLILVDLLSLGQLGLDHRQAAAEAFEAMIAQSFAEAPEGGEISPTSVQAFVGGFQRICYQRARAGDYERLRGEFEVLVDWGLGYQRPRATSRRPLRAVGKLEMPDLAEIWDESPPGSRDWSALGQRERIIRAAATVAGERGYGSLSIPAITRLARVSNETFYEHFSSVHEAFLEAIDILGARALGLIEAEIGSQRSWEASVRRGLEVMLSFLAANPLLARLPFIEAMSASPAAMDRVDLMLDTLTEMFGLREAPGPGGEALALVVVDAIVGGVYIVIQRQIAEGRVTDLLELAPKLEFILLAPYGKA